MNSTSVLEIVPYKEPPLLAGLASKPPAVFLSNEKARDRFFGFFTANIRNKNTRRAYYKAACRFSGWCEGRGLLDFADLKPPHIATYIEWLSLLGPHGQGLSKPPVKQHLAARRTRSTSLRPHRSTPSPTSLHAGDLARYWQPEHR
jgi:hypothetical protein